MAVKPIPENYPRVTPYLSIKGAADAIEFYRKAFGAVERMRIDGPDGKVGHSELTIGEALIMLADEYPEMDFRSPASLGGSSVVIHLYVEDVDAFCERAVAAGAKLTRAVEDQFYGDRSGQLRDPYGHVWSIATHKEDVSLDEMKKRAAAMYG
ncbi:MAG TPA: VOC family protein [Burkholderiales bacterium]|nr:VOC family protein [Burkholderiales bacterium]